MPFTYVASYAKAKKVDRSWEAKYGYAPGGGGVVASKRGERVLIRASRNSPRRLRACERVQRDQVVSAPYQVFKKRKI